MTSPKGERYHEQDVQHLFRAIRRGKAHLTRFMLAASNNVLLNCWDPEGKTPLIECCYIKEEVTRDRMVRILKEAGADVNMPDKEGRTPLIHACEKRCNDIVRILIQHCNISPDIADKDGNTALIHAAFIGNDIALEILVRHFRRLGLQVDHYNQAGYTALHIAAKSGFLQCAKILAVKGKASLTIKDKVHGLTPLDWSLKEGYQKSEVEFLKPSAKFYRLAKLTTTMVKYRKRSSVTSQESLPQISDAAKPAKAVDKAKGKVKHLLKKSPQTQDDSEFMAIGAGCVPKQIKSGGISKTPLAKAASADPSKQKPSGKKSWSKASRQRSLTLTGNKETLTAPKQKGALKHSLSNPGPGKSEMSEAVLSNCQENYRTTDVPKSLALYKHAALHDDLGAQIDTDEDSSCSDTESVSLIESLNRSPTSKLHVHNKESITCGGVYCGEVSSSSDADRSSYGILSLSQYADGGVYCGDIKSSNLKNFSTSPEGSTFQSSTCNTPSFQRGSSPIQETDSNSEFTSAFSSANIQSPVTLDSFTHVQPIKNRYNGKDGDHSGSIRSVDVALKSDIEESKGFSRQTSESSENSITSPLTTMEVVADIRRKKDASPLSDKSKELNADTTNSTSSKFSRSETECTVLDDECSCSTELTQIEGRISSLSFSDRDVKPWEARGKQIGKSRSSSTDTTMSDISSCTQITLIGNISTTSTQGHVGKSPNSTRPTDKRLVEESKNCAVSNVSSNLVTDTRSSLGNHPAFYASGDESVDDDSETEKTYVVDSFQGRNVRKFDKNSSNGDKTPKLSKEGQSKQNEVKVPLGKRIEDDQNKIECTSIKDQTSSLNARATSPTVTPNESGRESQCQSVIAPISPNSNSTNVESRQVNIYSNGQQKRIEEQSSTSIGQCARDTRHIESIT